MDLSEAKLQQPPPFLFFDDVTAWPGHGARLPYAPSGPARAKTFVHQPHQRQQRRTIGPYPSRAVLGILLLWSAIVAAACWNAKPGTAHSGQGIDLRAEVVSPKFNNTSAELPPKPAAQPEPEITRPEPPKPFLAPEMPPAPPSFEAKAPPQVQEPQALAPVVFYGPGTLQCSCFKEPPPGDTPMLRNWNVLKMSSLLVVAMTVTPLPAMPQEPGQPDLKDLTESVNKLKKACDDQKDTIDKQKEALATIGDKLDKLIVNTTSGFNGINSDLNKIKGDIKVLTEDSAETKLSLQGALGKIKSLEEQVAFLKSEMGRLQKRDPSLYPAGTGLEEIKSRLEKIETTLAKLAESRTSFSPPVGAGKIQLANMYPEEMLFVINSKPYRVQPNTTVDLPNQPAGPFTYEVISGTFGLRARNTPTLETGKTYTITVR